MSSSFLENEKCSFGVDPKNVVSQPLLERSQYPSPTQYLREHRVIFFLANLCNRLLQHSADRVDHNINMTEITDNIFEQFRYCSCRGQIALVEGDLDRRVLFLKGGY